MTIIVFIGFLIFCYIFRDSYKNKHEPKKEKPKKKNISTYSEEGMDKYYLEEWQKDLVKEGRFAPWSFKKNQLIVANYVMDNTIKMTMFNR